MPAKYLIIIAGPTAVGKTGMAIRLARHFGTEIINADSRQVYHEMKIGTAVPTPRQLSEVKHHLVGHRSIHQRYNASIFEQEAIEILDRLFADHDIVLAAGGSGLYINAVCKGIDDIPAVDASIRERLQQEFMSAGLTGIQARLLQTDPEYYHKADLNNPKRILKALEIAEMTGRTYSSFLTGHAKNRNFKSILIGLDLPRDELHVRINRRVDTMMAAGLPDEVRELYPFRHLNALNTVGYKELFPWLENKYSLNEAADMIRNHTRQYARRQLTWFRKGGDMPWFLPDTDTSVLKFLHDKMKADERP
jgi:tRNA dimethylallyltransferase